MKLSIQDKHYIAQLIEDESSERYPLELLAAFKGPDAFDLHSEMVSLQDAWLEKFSNEDKKKSLLLVFIQTTVSKATLKNPSLKPASPVRRIKIMFDIPGSYTVRSGYGYTSAKGKKCLKRIQENKGKDLA